ncbi:MAG: Rieske (2Fe-2S) protein, partial [Acidobacteria bacterium]|nr:Rieske (2Fe-2S) protein [Acidobacteriota bacterium]
KLWKRATAAPAAAVSVAAIEELPVGGYKLFRYPTGNDPCILLRLAADKFAAFNQNCTHLACPVFFEAAVNQLVCPCHKGFFSAEDGRVIAGPPKRPLEKIDVSVRDGRVWVQLS